jgi:hypothetical protein
MHQGFAWIGGRGGRDMRLWDIIIEYGDEGYGWCSSQPIFSTCNLTNHNTTIYIMLSVLLVLVNRPYNADAIQQLLIRSPLFPELGDHYTVRLYSIPLLTDNTGLPDKIGALGICSMLPLRKGFVSFGRI